MTNPFQAAWMILKEGGYRTEENPHDTRAHNDARIAQHDQSHGAPIPQPSNDGQRLIDMLANEENSYGDTSNREHPFHGEEGYEDNARGGRGHALDIPEPHGVEGLMEGQQPEADEMDAMGVEPMGRTLGGKPPANLGQAGSLSDANPERHSINPFAMDDAMNHLKEPMEEPMGEPMEEPMGMSPARTLTDTPRHERRGQEGAGRAFDKPKRPSWWRGE